MTIKRLRLMIDAIFVFPDARASGLVHCFVASWFQPKTSGYDDAAIRLGCHAGLLSALLARHSDVNRSGIGPSLSAVLKHFTRMLFLFAPFFLALGFHAHFHNFI